MDNLIEYMIAYAEAQKAVKAKAKELTAVQKPYATRIKEIVQESLEASKDISLEVTDLQCKAGECKKAVLIYVRQMAQFDDIKLGRTKLPNGAWVQIDSPKLSIEVSDVAKFLAWLDFHNVPLESVVELSPKPDAIEALESVLGTVPGLMTVEGESVIRLSVGKLSA